MTRISIVEVGPRDGFQPVSDFIPTKTKFDVIERLRQAGLSRIETTSFVNERAVPQMSDARDIVAACNGIAGLDAQVLTPTARQCGKALEAGVRHIVFVLSVSEAHNRSNVKRSPAESVEEYAAVVAQLPIGLPLRLNVATAFDCPFEGRVEIAETIDLLDRLAPLAPGAEIALCDTTGRATPGHVEDLFVAAMDRFPNVSGWAFHGHDTYGQGVANALAAFKAGVRVFDSSIAGLGGCPFAPGATGNTATEDLVWMFDGMGVQTGIDFKSLIALSGQVRLLPGVQVGGRVFDALQARVRLERAA